MSSEFSAQSAPGRVLVVGRHPPRMEAALSQLAAAGLSAVGALRDDEALAQVALGPALVLFGGGVEPASRDLILAAFHRTVPGRPSLVYHGDPSGLADAVRAALQP